MFTFHLYTKKNKKRVDMHWIIAYIVFTRDK